MDNKNVIRDFFAAFGRRDADGMIRHYHQDFSFEDPVFGKLTRSEAAAMWKMLCGRATDLQVELRSFDADEKTGYGEWEAKYTFAKTGNFVHNKIRSQFRFRDGLIVEQKDHFDLWRWASMALGTRGRLLGWTPIVQNAVRKEAQRSLQRYRSSQSEQATPGE